MRTIGVFKDFVDEMKLDNSRNYKISVLTKWKNNEIVKAYLNFIFNPFVRTGISAKKFERAMSMDAPGRVSPWELMQYLQQHNTGTDEDLAVVAACDTALGPSYRDLLRAVVCKDLSIGIDAKTINKVIPGFIPEFACMLAERYFEQPEKLEGHEFAITTKLDGFRLIVFKNVDGSIECYSRVGQPVEGLVEIEADLAALPCNTALDGELTITNYFDMPSKDAYKAASKIIRLKGDTPKRGLTYRVFDCMTVDEFKTQSCIKPYVERRAMLDSFPKMNHVEVLPVLYAGNDTSKITEWLDKITAEGGEGCMLNLLEAPYIWGRTWNLMKVKKMNDIDLAVIDFEEGSGRLAGTLGALIVRYKNNSVVRVGSGFSDEQRKEIWESQQKYLGAICTVQYFETTVATTGVNAGQESLRFPVFRDFRFDKTEADF